MSTKSKVALSEENKPSRRKFFIGASAAVGVVAVASQTPVGKAVIQEISGTKVVNDVDQAMSTHMRKYYESTLI